MARHGMTSYLVGDQTCTFPLCHILVADSELSAEAKSNCQIISSYSPHEYLIPQR